MKKLTVSLYVLVFSNLIKAATCSPDLSDFPDLELDLDENGESDVLYLRSVNNLTSGFSTSSSINYGVIAEGSNRLVYSSGTDLRFSEGQMISAANTAFVNGVGFSAFPLTVYKKTVLSGALEASCTSNDSIPSWNARVEGILGLRIQGNEGVHHGWVRFTRPDTEPSTPFQIASYDWNPVPDAPIEAGLPPPPPPVQFQVLPEGLLLGWDYRFTGLFLECADSLTEPVEWRPVDGVEGSQIILPPGEGSRFYRLRRP